MILSLGSTALILLITASLALRRGLYRTTILFFCCLISAVVAFGFYENVLALLDWEFVRQFGEGSCLLLLFMVTALVLDMISEYALTGNMRLPVLVDRIGGGFVGFWTAMISVGVLCVAIQMLPWDKSVLGYERIERVTGSREVTHRLLLRPDDFVVGLVGYLSDNAMSSDQRLRSIHPDLLDEVARSNMRVQAESRRVVPPDVEGAATFDVLSIAEIEDPALGYVRFEKAKSSPTSEDQVKITVESKSRGPKDDHRFLVVQCKLRVEAGDPEDKYHRFTPQQVRMVGTLHGKPKQYFMAGYREPSEMKALGLVSPEQPIVFRGQREHAFNLIFEVADDFVPSFVEYKRLARAAVPRGEKIPVKSTEAILASLKYVPPLDLTKEKGGALPPGLQKELDKRIGAPQPPTPQRTPPPGGKTPPKPPPRQPADKQPPKPNAMQPTKGQPTAADGRVGGRRVSKAGFSDKLPFALHLKDVTDQQAEVSGNAFKSGHIVVPATNARGGNLVTAFAVPRDVRLLQLECRALHARSILGQAKAMAVKSVGQYTVLDDKGQQYQPVGEYRIATVDGKSMLELQYDAEALPGRAIRPPKRIQETDLKDNDPVTLLYHIQPGAKLVEFTAGPHALAKSPLNATAPD